MSHHSGEFGVVIASPSPVVRKGTEILVHDYCEGKISVFLVQTSAEVRHRLQHHPIHLLIIEVQLAEEEGMNWTKIKFTYPQLKTIVLHRCEIQAQKGRYSYNLLLDAPEELFLRTLKEVFPKRADGRRSDNNSGALTKREEEILRFMAQGVTTKEMAQQLHLSHHTISTHRKNIINKLGIKTIAGLMVYAVMHGIIDLEDME